METVFLPTNTFPSAGGLTAELCSLINTCILERSSGCIIAKRPGLLKVIYNKSTWHFNGNFQLCQRHQNRDGNVGWPRLKYLKDGNIFFRHSWSPQDKSWGLWWSPTSPLTPPAGRCFHLSCKISRHTLDGWAEHLVQTVMVPRGWILIMLLSSSATMR